MWDRRAQYISNNDGDTVKLRLDQGYEDEKKINVRLFGVWAPESDEIGGEDLQEFVHQWFLKRMVPGVTWPFISVTMRMKVADREQMSITRYVGTITGTDANDSLNLAAMQYIIAKGYGGGIGAK